MDEAQIPFAAIAAFQGLVLALVGAKGGLDFEGLGMVLRCRADGVVRRGYALLSSLVVLLLSVWGFEGKLTALGGACVVEGALVTFAAVADGMLDVKGLKFAQDDLRWWARGYLALVGALLLYGGQTATPVGPTILSIIAGFSALVTIASQLELLFVRLRSEEEGPDFRLAMAPISVFMLGASVFLASRAKPVVAASEPARTAVPRSRPVTEPASSWIALLHAAECPQPCSGGVACDVSEPPCQSGIIVLDYSMRYAW